jgi:hypothetical protein
MSELLAKLQARTRQAQLQDSDEGGERILRFPDGATYFGEEAEGMPHGRGELRLAGGTLHYDGGFERGMYQGRGVLTLENGDTWDGSFSRNLQHGFGVHRCESLIAKASEDASRPRLLKRRASRRSIGGEEDAAAAAALRTVEEALRERRTFYWRGRLVCNEEQLLNSRVRVRCGAGGKAWRTGTVVERRAARGAGRAPQYRVRFEDDHLDSAGWWDLSIYELQLLEAGVPKLHYLDKP